MRHVNIPIFIPHLGCPHACAFCNQRLISGVDDFDPNSVSETIERVLSTVTPQDEVEIAFFGGSFTAIERERMIALLEIGASYVDSGRVRSLRSSTRPDAINPEIVSILKQYGMTTVEIGVQSVSDAVLLATSRGHTRADIEYALTLLRQSGIKTVGQMMIGLPNATLSDEEETLRAMIDLGVDAVRIYPTVVFLGTELHRMALDGRYTPLSVDEAVERGARLLQILDGTGVVALRIGLCATDGLSDSDTVFGGAYHPALGEMIKSRYFYYKLKQKIQQASPSAHLTVFVPRGALSQAIGHKKMNKRLLMAEFSLQTLDFCEREGLVDCEISLLMERKIPCT